MKRRLTSLLAVLGLGACLLVFEGDLEVSWSVDGVRNSSAICATYGIAMWHIDLVGPEMTNADVPCDQPWNTGPAFRGAYAIAEGNYQVTVTARSAGGGTLASRSKTISVISDVQTIWTADIQFTSSDFRGGQAVCGNNICESGETTATCPQDCKITTCGNGICETGETQATCPADCTTGNAWLHVSWKINGTTDGTAGGPSWDTCDEVGAANVMITIDGTPRTVPCNGVGNSVAMSTAISGLSPGAHQVKVKLLDAANNALTTEASDTLTATVGSSSQEAFEFLFNSFFEPKKSSTMGDYFFKTTYEGGKSCGGPNPKVASQYVLLKLDGTPITKPVCGPGQSGCPMTNGADKGSCWDPNMNQTISGLKWGAYKLKITASPSTAMDLCWSTRDPKTMADTIDIMVGAGSLNPVVTHDLARISNSGACL